jgi:hypothetical protein
MTKEEQDIYDQELKRKWDNEAVREQSFLDGEERGLVLKRSPLNLTSFSVGCSMIRPFSADCSTKVPVCLSYSAERAEKLRTYTRPAIRFGDAFA